MSGRFQTPSEQFSQAGEPLSGGKLYFFVTGTNTPSNTYSDAALTTPNTNPVILDAEGRAGDIWLDPNVAYKVVLADAESDETSPIWTHDPVSPGGGGSSGGSSGVQVIAGNPNGALAGSAGTPGASNASTAWDITNNLFYVCSVSGDASTAVWTQVATNQSGQIAQTGVITPTTIAADTDDWAPTGIGSVSTIRAEASAAYWLGGLVAQPAGTLMTIVNKGATYPITLRREKSTSTAANRFALPHDIEIAPGGAITLKYDGTSSRWRPQDLPGPQSLAAPGGRLTLTTNTPVQTANATAATTIYYTPYLGFSAPLYDGAVTRMRLIPAELSLALDSDSGHTGYHQSGKAFDLFLFDDAGTIRLVSGPAWTNDTTRASALAYKNGFLTNNSSITVRFGSASGNTVTMPANQGLYVGSFYASANGQTAMNMTPAAASGGADNKLYLWNCYNRVRVAAVCRDSDDTWNYTTATWRAANGSNSNRITFFRGLNDGPVDVSYFASSGNSTGGVSRWNGVGLDSTSAFSGLPGIAAGGSFSTVGHVARFNGFAGLGLHYAQALERSTASGTTAWIGDNGTATVEQSGLYLSMDM